MSLPRGFTPKYEITEEENEDKQTHQKQHHQQQKKDETHKKIEVEKNISKDKGEKEGEKKEGEEGEKKDCAIGWKKRCQSLYRGYGSASNVLSINCKQEDDYQNLLCSALYSKPAAFN